MFYRTHTPHEPEESMTTQLHHYAKRRGYQGKKVASIVWRELSQPTTIYSSLPLPKSDREDGGVSVRLFLKRTHRLSRSHLFTGDDGKVYRWQAIGGLGCTLTRVEDKQLIAESRIRYIDQGPHANTVKPVLKVETKGHTLDLNMIMLSFLIIDRKRRQKHGEDYRWCPDGTARDEINWNYARKHQRPDSNIGAGDT
ncbi:hypothetical protein CC2G_006041 [Coprinopsis cinerea AmutBmut pab1-1]|nr:hypothetical protein CC2G_006041 [Coprinopsis cinerea AmutBmut pab1-1]